MNESDTPEKATATEGDPSTARLRDGIEHTRAGLSATISALETRLSPDELREKMGVELQHVESKVRDVIREHLAEAKTLVKEELVEAKNLLREEMNDAEAKIKKGLTEARDKVKSDLREELTHVESKLKQGLSDARDHVKHELQEAVTGAKRSARAATLGKVENLATDIGDAMNDTRDTLLDTIRQNPLPAALAGVGLAWLLMNRSKSASRTRSQGFVDPRGHAYAGEHDVREGVRHAMHEAQGTARHVVDDIGSALGSAVHRASDVANGLAHDASEATAGAIHQASDAAGAAMHGASEAGSALAHGAADASSQIAHRVGDAATYVGHHTLTEVRRAEHALQTTLHENPLAFGAAALVVGAAVGFALPRTPGEDKIMGETRDAVIRRAGSAAHDAAILVGHIGEKTAESAKQLLSDSPAANR
jgi:ABC-type transporter Mla subunit MlaD